MGSGTLGSIVACPTSGGCVLAAQSGGTAVWNGTTTTTVATPTPPLLALSCGSVDLCFGVGSSDDLVYRWDGATWTTVVVPMNHEVYSVGYYDVTCSSDEHCLLVGRSWDPFPSPDVYPEAARWDGTTWTATPVPAGVAVLTTVACASPAGCVAIGISTEGSTAPPPLVAIAWNGGSWYTAPAPPAPASVDAFDYYGTEISCSPDERCLTVNSASIGGVSGPVGARYDWSAA